MPGPASKRPIAKRYNTDGFADREQLLLTIFLLWRANPGFIFTGVSRQDQEYETLIKDSIKLYIQPNDKTVRMAAFKTNMELGQYSVDLTEGDEWYEASRPHLMHSAYVIQHLKRE